MRIININFKFISMKKELEELRKEFNDRIDSLLKPKFEVGKWHKHKKGFIFNCTSINQTGNMYGYGINEDGSWFEELEDNGYTCACNSYAVKDLIPATESEVLLALTNEASKLGLIGGRRVIGYDYTVTHNYFMGCGGLYLGHEMSSNIMILDTKTGVWATPIPKEKTLEQICQDFDKFYYEVDEDNITVSKSLLRYLSKNNLTIT